MAVQRLSNPIMVTREYDTALKRALEAERDAYTRAGLTARAEAVDAVLSGLEQDADGAEDVERAVDRPRRGRPPRRHDDEPPAASEVGEPA